MDTLVPIVLAALLQAANQFPGVEAGGAVYQCDGQPAVALPPASTGQRGGADLRLPKRLNGCPMVALYHTHPAGKFEFSSEDIVMACALALPSYMLPQGDAARVFDCGGHRPGLWLERARANPRVARGRELPIISAGT